MDIPQQLRILAAGDLHGSQRGADWFYAQCGQLAPDLVLFLGDFVTGGPLSFAIEVLRELRMLDAPCFVIPGNWDPREITVHMDEQAYDGLRNLHKSSAHLGGYSFAGLGGSIPTPSHKSPIEAPDEGFADPLVTRLPADVWVLHNPLRGWRDFATAVSANIGSESLLTLYNSQVEENAPPLLVVSGHVHEARGIERGGPEDATLFVNPGPLSQHGAALITLTGRCAEAELIGGE